MLDKIDFKFIWGSGAERAKVYRSAGSFEKRSSPSQTAQEQTLLRASAVDYFCFTQALNKYYVT